MPAGDVKLHMLFQETRDQPYSVAKSSNKPSTNRSLQQDLDEIVQKKKSKQTSPLRSKSRSEY